MKALLTILSIFFITACSDVDMGGYTESILKQAGSSNISESQGNDNQQILRKQASPLDDDLSSLDEEELREKLMNTYPWTLAKDGSEPESSESEGSSSSVEVIVSGKYNIPSNPYDGKILNYYWKSIAPGFDESPDHKYGFDRDPTDRDPIVYLSVETNQKASFIPRLSHDLFNNFYLVPDYDKNIKIKLTANTPIYLEKGGLYTLYGELNIRPGRMYLYTNKEENNTKRQIKVIPYEPQTKNLVYIELNGNNWNPAHFSNSFTKQHIIKTFNEVYKQAVINVTDKSIKTISANDFGINIDNIKEYFESEDFKKEYGNLDINDYIKNGLLVVNMTTPTANNPLYEALIKIAEQNKNYSDSYNNDGTINKESPYWHIVYAINKVRKEWHLDKCKKEHKSLISCKTFDPQNDPKSPTVQYFRYNTKTGKVPEPVDINMVRVKKGSVEETGYAIFINGTMQELDDDEILYTENGLPIVPNARGVTEGLGGASFAFVETKHDDYLPYGSIVFAPRRTGETGTHILMHELGHSFGLTDVSQSDIYKITETANTIIHSTTKKFPYDNYYASAETNLMSWSTPNGKKLRYRPTQIVCTGGTKYYTDLQTFKGAVEREIVNGEEHQWDCLRGECYNSDDKEKKYSSTQRKNFWDKTDRCKEEPEPIENEKAKKRLTDEATYTKDKDKEMSKKIINYNIEYTEKEKKDLSL